MTDVTLTINGFPRRLDRHSWCSTRAPARGGGEDLMFHGKLLMEPWLVDDVDIINP
jgi:hypothetical protein